MHALLALALGTAAIGVDVGWQPADDGGLEYIIQIEPETLARLKTGDQLSASIRPVLQDVRRYRIVVGTGALPHVALPDQPAAPALPSTTPVRSSRQGASAAQMETTAAASLTIPRELPDFSVLVARDGVRRIEAPSEPVAPRREIAELAKPVERRNPVAQAAPRTESEAAKGWSPQIGISGIKLSPRDPLSAVAGTEFTPGKSPSKTVATAAEPWQTVPIRQPAPSATPSAAPLGDRYASKAIESKVAPKQVLPAVQVPAPSLPATPRIVRDEPEHDRYKDLFRDQTPVRDPAPKTSAIGVTLAGSSHTGQPVERRAEIRVAAMPTEKPASSQAPGILPRDSKIQPAWAEMGDETRKTGPQREGFEANTNPRGDRYAQASPSHTPTAGEQTPAEPARPWFALTATLFALFASLGGNVFLGWVAHDARRSYRRSIEGVRLGATG